MKAKLIKKNEHYFLETQPYTLSNLQRHTIIANTFDKPKGHILQLSLKNCQAIERGYDLEEVYNDYFKEWSPYSDLIDSDVFEAGFQKALELMGDKKFSEEDVRKAMDLNRKSLWTQDESIQSLQQTEWDVEIVQEEGKDTFGNAELTWYNPKLDADGCLILKRAE